MKKIGIFTGYFLPHMGGVERYTDKLSSELRKLGYEIVIVTFNHDNLPSYQENDVKLYRLPVYDSLKQRYPIYKKNKEYRKIINMIKNENIDFYICNTRFQLTSLIGTSLAKKSKKPMLLIEHGSSHFTVNNRILDYMGGIYEHRLTSMIKKNCKHFFGVSMRCNEWLKHFNIKADGVFYNSIDFSDYDKFKNKKYKKSFKDKLVITFAGRIIKEKGIILLLEAFLRLSREFENLELVVAGDGPLLKELVERYKAKNIHFEGKLSYEEVMSLYNVTDIFAHPSMYPEGLPTVILESGIMKCAVVATDRGGTTEVITSDKYGFICEENEESLYQNLRRVIVDDKLRENLKNNIHERICDEFTWSKTALRVKKAMEEIENER